MTGVGVTASRPDQVFAGYAFDLDGTVYLGEAALPGAVEAIARLRALGRPVVFVTNKPLDTATDYAAKLTRLGIPAKTRDVITAVDSLLGYLRLTHDGERIMALAEGTVRMALRDAGFHLTDEPEETDTVVVSFDRTFDYARLNAAYRAIRLHGAALVATNPDAYCPTPDGGLPDCAAMLAAIEACTGARAEAVTGKPSPHMARAMLDRLGVPAHSAALVGDRTTTDMAMARSSGMTGILVLSGASGPADLAAMDGDGPSYVIKDLRDLLPCDEREDRSA